MKLSIIVPVYNVEKYILQCIDSICNQTIKEIEIIVVDDGSKDSSIDIVKKYKDNRIRIITKENGGLSSARNEGIKEAKGEYISFIDSDDFIKEKFSLEEMYNISRKYNSDITVGTGIEYYSENKQIPFYRNKNMYYERVMNSEDFLIEALKSKSFNYGVCLNMYKREFLINNNLFFKEGILHEDVLHFVQAFLKSKVISIYPREFYMYRQREGSIMHSGLNPKRLTDICNIMLELDEYIKKIENRRLKKELGGTLAHLLFRYLYDYNSMSISSELNKFMIKNAFNIKYKLFYILLIYNPALVYKLMKLKEKLVR